MATNKPVIGDSATSRAAEKARFLAAYEKLEHHPQQVVARLIYAVRSEQDSGKHELSDFLSELTAEGALYDSEDVIERVAAKLDALYPQH
jgi:hypothetical protein